MITYSQNKAITPEQLGTVFQQSGITRPDKDIQRLEKMIKAAQLLVTAWDNDRLIGVARSLTDFSYCCYLSDLAVVKEFQNEGVGRELIEQTQTAIGPQCSLILLSAPAAMDYYPKVDFTKADNCFFIKRKQ